jgi:hypothetical protein
LSQATTSSTTKFKLPSLKLENKSSESPPNNLLDYVKSQQPKDSSLTQIKFTIPNIFASKPKSNPMIDLKSALLSENEKKKLPKEEVKIVEKKDEFIPKFIECDLKSRNSVTENENVVICVSTLKDLIDDESLPIHQPSMMGKIIGKRFQKTVPYIRHAYEPLKDIDRFKFDVPSPDDQILAHLQKK